MHAEAECLGTKGHLLGAILRVWGISSLIFLRKYLVLFSLGDSNNETLFFRVAQVVRAAVRKLLKWGSKSIGLIVTRKNVT